ncbi:cytochrome P450 [Xylariales sp. PMI_506]|nr:cytochrome P450 [Xylariales sp. PMI_506]
MVAVGLSWVCLKCLYVDIPQIKGIPEIPGGELLAGHLHKLGRDHATTAEKWFIENDWPVYQIRMGRRRAVILNTFESARDWMIKNQSATLDRPWFYTFHGVLSATSAATIGTSPWEERTKKQRRVVGSFTTGPSIQKLRSLLDIESAAVVSKLYYDGQNGDVDIMPHVYLKRLALNVMMMFCYGTRFSSVTNPLLLQILKDATTIASFRSTNSNAQDFIPHLRYVGKNGRTAEATEVRGRRDKWLATMLDDIQDSLKLKLNVGGKKSVAQMLLEDNEEGLTKLDVKTILGGLMSGGFETIYSTAIIAVGMLSTPEGQLIQQKAYEDIMSVYDSPEQAFELCLTEEKSAYVMGLVKESLRFYPPLKLLPARQVYKDFKYQESLIPKGVLIYMNAQAINRDKATYGPDADVFRPERWTEKECDVPPPYHFSYGAGARMCTAVNFANRVMYAMFVRIIVTFRITQSKDMQPVVDYVGYKRDPTESNAIPSDFKVNIKARDQEVLERCLKHSHDNLPEFVAGSNAEPLIK